MDKRGINLIAVFVLFTLVAAIFILVIYLNMDQTMLYLAPEPEVDCYGLNFQAQIVQDGEGSILDVTNLGIW